MKIQRHKAVQVHPVPDSVIQPQGPFPPNLRGYNPRFSDLTVEGSNTNSMESYEEQAHPAAQPELVTDYTPALSEDGAEYSLGATAQNNFKAPKILICSHCEARVPENKTGDHVCDI